MYAQLHTDNDYRQRLASLYSDFTLQRYSNPDGYAANTSAWINIFEKAAQAGLLPGDEGNQSILSLVTGDNLLRSLETREYGRPLALSTVIVGVFAYCPRLLTMPF